MPKKKKRILTALAAVMFIGLLFITLRYAPQQAECKLTNDKKPDKNITLQSSESEDALDIMELKPEPEPAEPTKEPEKEEAASENKEPKSTANNNTPATNSTKKPKTNTNTGNENKTPTPPPTSAPTPAPTPSRPTAYVAPSTHHFYKVKGSSMPGNKKYAEFSIIMDCVNHQTGQYDAELYKLQLQELRTVILPVLGEDITNKIIQAAERKTHENITIDEAFETDTKKVVIGSTPGYSLVHFQSWAK
jgi:cytoskeletal protein RodZ